MFSVGDRVRKLHDGVVPPGALGTVAEIKRRVILVHFDNPKFEAWQEYSSGWYETSFELIDNESSFIPEDWS